MKIMRVVQWTTGIVGRTSLRSIIAHPKLELVGVYCYSDDKVGVDAGIIADILPVGIKATNRIEDIVALKPDCVVYMPQWPNIDHIELLLSSGINIVTTARIITGRHYKDNAGERIEKAAKKGGATFYGTGMNPMFIPTLTLAATALCGTVTKVSITESTDCVMYEGVGTWEAYGFGKPLNHAELKQDLWDAEPDYRELLEVIAGALDVTLDDMTLDVEYALADADRDLGFMKIAKGTVAAIDATWTGVINAKPFIEVKTLWKLGGLYGHTETPNWDVLYGYKLSVEGDMNINLECTFLPEDISNIDIGIPTAMPAINAIPQVCAARPGVVTPKDLTLITSRGRVHV
jgi:2,4-diaminopentanoate dehydrogenase